jgi:hypothetical protein
MIWVRKALSGDKKEEKSFSAPLGTEQKTGPEGPD